MDITKKSPSILSLCSGYGGLERVLERVFREITVLAHVEVEAFAIANLVNKMETKQMVPTPIWTDVKTFRSGIFRGYVDILTGSYPCQPFSVAGKRKGEDDPGACGPMPPKSSETANQNGFFFRKSLSLPNGRKSFLKFIQQIKG